MQSEDCRQAARAARRSRQEEGIVLVVERDMGCVLAS